MHPSPCCASNSSAYFDDAPLRCGYCSWIDLISPASVNEKRSPPPTHTPPPPPPPSPQPPPRARYTTFQRPPRAFCASDTVERQQVPMGVRQGKARVVSVFVPHLMAVGVSMRALATPVTDARMVPAYAAPRTHPPTHPPRQQTAHRENRTMRQQQQRDCQQRDCQQKTSTHNNNNNSNEDITTTREKAVGMPLVNAGCLSACPGESRWPRNHSR